MNSVDPNRPNPTTSESFSACDNIAAFYEKLNVPARKTVGALRGKSFTWYVTNEGQSFQIRCGCSVTSLGFGVLRIESRMASDLSIKRWFRKCPIVNPDTAKINIKSPLGFSEHEIRLPIPDKYKKQDPAKE